MLIDATQFRHRNRAIYRLGISAVPSQIYAVTPSPPNIYHHAPPAAPMEIELTPSVIAKAQKHCRFAISSLDYEDAEQARRELRAALAVLGG